MDNFTDTTFQQGLVALLDELKGLPGNIEANSLKKALEEMSVMFAAAATQEAPVSSEPRTVKFKNSSVTFLPGALKYSMEPAKIRKRKGLLRGGIKGIYYTKFVEMGHTLRQGDKDVGHSPGNAFIARAFDKTKEWAMDVAKRTLVEEIEKRVTRLKRKMAKAQVGG